MTGTMPSIIDLATELAKLRMARRTPHSTREDTRGSVASLAPYRDGLLLAVRSSGTDHWERHLPGDELVHVLDGSMTLEIACGDEPPRSYELRAGMMIVIPQNAWHRSHSEGNTHINLTPFPGDHIALDVEDPRIAEREPKEVTGPASIVDLTATLAKLTTMRGRTPQSTMADREGSAARLASYRDGALTVSKFAGKGHWEKHVADELIHILDGSAALDVAAEGAPQSLSLGAGTMTVIPQETWHRFQSVDGVTLMTATPFPSEVIEFDVDDPRAVASG